MAIFVTERRVFLRLALNARILQMIDLSIAFFRDFIPYLGGRINDLDIPHQIQPDDDAAMPLTYLHLLPVSKRVPDGKTPNPINCSKYKACESINNFYNLCDIALEWHISVLSSSL
ncbi:hypothetical protein EV127DRAFT_491511 [Xylaria flabelliformis]|nr:hypothetical protein EV127DRAFT_491511 [Xylaria flabelliformis]